MASVFANYALVQPQEACIDFWKNLKLILLVAIAVLLPTRLYVLLIKILLNV